MSEPPLLNLFLRLRDAGLVLGMEQYHLAVSALLQSIDRGLDIADQAAVARLCKTIWVKSRQQERLFDQCWHEIISHQVRSSKSIIEPPITKALETPEIESGDNIITDREGETETEIEFVPAAFVPSYSGVVTAVRTKLREGYYFPVSRQQLRLGWQLLRQKLPSSVPSEMDVQATVRDVSQRGFFVKPILTAAQIKYKEVVLLIDKSSSMTPFAPFCRQLREIWQAAKVYYFHNTPTDELYDDTQCLQGEAIKSILARFSPEKTLVIIVSDAGAARRRTVPSRWEETVDFLAMLTPHINRVAWLNPLPRFHWRDTTAEFIAKIKINSFVPMFALDAAEYQQMLQWLLYGKPSVKGFLQQADKKSQGQQQFGSFNIWEIEEYNAQGIIQAFEKMFGQGHLKLACDAAFPLLLTPDLLYCLWKNFWEQRQKKSGVPWYAVADILLSDLCQQVDVELYEMTAEVRNQLLQNLTENHLQELSKFLQKYIQRQVSKQKPDVLLSDLLQVQQWTALAYIKKGDEAAKQLAEKLRQAYLQSNKAELVRLAEVIETLAQPLAEKYAPLLVVARGYGALARGDKAGKVAAQNELKQRLGEGETVDVAGVILERPEDLKLIRLSPPFEVVTVNRRGKIIRRETKQAKYFIEYLGDGVSLEMMLIPGDKFMMGSPPDEAERYDDESPQHEVSVPSFFMGKFPVTQAQWRAVAGFPQVNRELDPEPSNFKGDNLPVERISWYEAVEFCDRLSQYTNRHYRLPSEAEWEYACRAGTTTPFHFGETITSKLANYHAEVVYGDAPKGKSQNKTTPVGKFNVANAFGLYDMHGNVWEWCADHWHSNYDGTPLDGSAWINNFDNDNQSRLLRGGSWDGNPRYCRSAFRYVDDPGNRYLNIGFRVVVSAVRT